MLLTILCVKQYNVCNTLINTDVRITAARREKNISAETAGKELE